MKRHLKSRPTRSVESPIQRIGKRESILLFNIKFQDYGSI